MTRPAMKYHGLRFPRTLDSAFRTPRYACAIESPVPSLWRRLFLALWS